MQGCNYTYQYIVRIPTVIVKVTWLPSVRLILLHPPPLPPAPLGDDGQLMSRIPLPVLWLSTDAVKLTVLQFRRRWTADVRPSPRLSYGLGHMQYS